jgi:sugar transferase (PEP-CTERM/EpsH1 system associated)
MSWLYRREGRLLLAHEQALASRARASFFVTDKECALFEQLAPRCRGLPRTLGNGVDADFFAPDARRASPFGDGELPLVFTGAMDYWPNVDAVRWFTAEMLPALRERWPAVRLNIVGRSPTPAVLALAGNAVTVTGTVPDVRPYLQHAAAVVAPLRLARGVQNKVLEAMAMARPVVAASSCVEAIDAIPGKHVLPAESPDDYIRCLDDLLAGRVDSEQLGAAARDRVLSVYGWEARLRDLDPYLEPSI